MNTIKSFLLGAGTAYAIYYITKKRPDGTSILGDLMDNPSFYLNKAKDYAIKETMRTVKEQITWGSIDAELRPWKNYALTMYPPVTGLSHQKNKANLLRTGQMGGYFVQ